MPRVACEPFLHFQGGLNSDGQQNRDWNEPDSVMLGEKRGCEKNRPKRGVAQNAEEKWNGLADANRACPAELMVPDAFPIHRRFPAFDDDWRKANLFSGSRDFVSELVIIREKIDE